MTNASPLIATVPSISIRVTTIAHVPAAGGLMISTAADGGALNAQADPAAGENFTHLIISSICFQTILYFM